jgi:hypothetical protein
MSLTYYLSILGAGSARNGGLKPATGYEVGAVLRWLAGQRENRSAGHKEQEGTFELLSSDLFRQLVAK